VRGKIEAWEKAPGGVGLQVGEAEIGARVAAIEKTDAGVAEVAHAIEENEGGLH